jgi:hypothetical protein
MRVAGVTERLEVLDAVPPTLANRLDVVNSNRRFPSLRQGNVTPMPATLGASWKPRKEF